MKDHFSTRLTQSFASSILVAGMLSSSVAGASDSPPPNMIVILTDDLGFSDLGCYGSEIETPTLDRLANNGLRFTQFYNTAKCHSSRVSLLSGRWCKQAGDISLNRAVTIPEVLAPAGYFTAMTGKWHLAKDPLQFGFQTYWGHLSGACNYFTGDNTFRLDDQPWEVPESDFYTTVANVDFALDFLGQAREAGKPYFLYVAFNAPHAPLQPLEEDYNKYLGRYDEGWDKVRSQRVAKQDKLDLFGERIEPSPRPDHIPAWKSLTPEMQDWESRRMTALAGMIDRIDQELARLVADLEKNGELDNTLILFLSDNGACPYDRNSIGIHEAPFRAESKWGDSTGWAWARNTPFRFYKQNQFEGGITTPAIVHWPAGLETVPGSIVHEPTHIVDILPTLAELGRAEIPGNYSGRDLSPLAGTSLVPILKGESLNSRPPIHLMFSKDRGLREGKWKLVSFQSSPWELYDIEADRTELNNLAAKHPERVEEMVELWTRIAKEQLRDQAPPVSDKVTPHIHREWTVYESPEASTQRHLSDRGKGKKKATPSRIRARKETTLEIENRTLIITCLGTESGLAFEGIPIPKDAVPPFTLSFQMKSETGAAGTVFVTTDAKTTLPKGEKFPFNPESAGDWESLSIPLLVEKPIHALRFDPSATPGVIQVKGLTLTDATGNIVTQWP